MFQAYLYATGGNNFPEIGSVTTRMVTHARLHSASPMDTNTIFLYGTDGCDGSKHIPTSIFSSKYMK